MSTDMMPDIQTRRAMLTERIAQYKALGYSHAMEAEALKVQTNGNTPAALKGEVEKQETMSRNAYAAAKRLQAMLDELPKEEAQVDA